jgi:hypothetical protein
VGIPRGRSISPEFLEPLRRQGGVARRILNIAMPEIGLEGPRVVPLLARAYLDRRGFGAA